MLVEREWSVGEMLCLTQCLTKNIFLQYYIVVNLRCESKNRSKCYWLKKQIEHFHIHILNHVNDLCRGCRGDPVMKESVSWLQSISLITTAGINLDSIDHCGDRTGHDRASRFMPGDRKPSGRHVIIVVCTICTFWWNEHTIKWW